MPTNSSPARFRIVLVRSTLILLMLSALGWVAYAQTQDGARVRPSFTKLDVHPASLGFKTLNFSAKRPPTSFQSRTFEIENTGQTGTVPGNPLTVTLGAVTGAGAADFQVSAAPNPIILDSKGSTTITVTYRPLTDGKATAEILITSDATRGKQTAKVGLSGTTKGPIPPTPTATVTPTATPTATPTSTASPSSSATPFPQGAGSTDRNSANAPGVIILGNLVTAYVPLGSDSFNAAGIAQVAIENGTSPLPGPAIFSSGRANSCALANTGEIVCSQQDGTIDLVPAASATTAATNLATGATVDDNYFAGDCIGCGAIVDSALGSMSDGLGIFATGNGFYTLDLSNIVNVPVGPIATTPAESVGADFGYDAANHRILNANYQVTNTSTNATTAPLFQIIDIANPASPIALI